MNRLESLSLNHESGAASPEGYPPGLIGADSFVALCLMALCSVTLAVKFHYGSLQLTKSTAQIGLDMTVTEYIEANANTTRLVLIHLGGHQGDMNHAWDGATALDHMNAVLFNFTDVVTSRPLLSGGNAGTIQSVDYWGNMAVFVLGLLHLPDLILTPMRLDSPRVQPFLTAFNNQSSALARNGLKRRRSDLAWVLFPSHYENQQSASRAQSVPLIR